MNDTHILPLVKFQALVLAPFGVALLLLALAYGCQRTAPEPPKQVQTITLENLQTAYAKSIRYQQMYSSFSKRAEKDRFPNVANLYRAVARSEGVHASNHASLMRSRQAEPQPVTIDSVVVGNTLQTLKMALSSEELEVESMYPNLIQTALAEKFSEAAEQFNFTKQADARQLDLLKDAQDRAGRIARVPYLVCTGCGYIFTSDETSECPTCHVGKDRFEKI